MRPRSMLKEIAAMLDGRVGIDPAKTSVETHAKLLEAIGEGVEIVAADGLLTDLRRVKDEVEIEAIAAAAALTDEVYAWIEERGIAGRTEREIALGAEAKMRELGAEDPSFTSIVAAGENGALPHADTRRSRDRRRRVRGRRHGRDRRRLLLRLHADDRRRRSRPRPSARSTSSSSTLSRRRSRRSAPAPTGARSMRSPAP